MVFHNSLYQMTAPCFCRSVLTCADDRFSVNIRSGPYYRTGHRKSVKIRKNSYGWQLCLKWPLLVGRTSAICHLLKYAQGQRLTHAVGISHWDLTLAHADVA